MRKLRPKEIELLKAFPKEIKLSGGGKVGGWMMRYQMPKGTASPTIYNLYSMGLIRIARNCLIDLYPLELTEEGKKMMEKMTSTDNHISRTGNEGEMR